MATLWVTFGKHIQTPAAPVMDGNQQRSFAMTIPEGSDGADASSFAANARENIVKLVADEDCYVEIGSAPDAQVPDDSTGVTGTKLTSGVPEWFAIDAGEKVSVVLA